MSQRICQSRRIVIPYPFNGRPCLVVFIQTPHLLTKSANIIPSQGVGTDRARGSSAACARTPRLILTAAKPVFYAPPTGLRAPLGFVCL